MRWDFWGIEIGVYLLFAVLLVDAWRRVRAEVVALVCYAAFGWAVEAVFQLMPPDPVEDMVYGHFLVMLPPAVPLWIPLGWGSLLYAAARTSDALAPPWWTRALYDGLLAAGISLALDPIAQHVGWYVFVNPQAYFGVPTDHAILYFVMAAVLSLFTRWGWQKWPPGKPWSDFGVPIGSALLGFAASTAIATAVGNWYTHAGGTAAVQLPPYRGQSYVFIAFFAVTLFVTVRWARPMRFGHAIAWPVFALPAFFFTYLLFVLYARRVFLGVPELIVAVSGAWILGMAAWSLPYLPDSKTVVRGPE